MAYKFDETFDGDSQLFIERAPAEIYAEIKRSAPDDLLIRVDDYMQKSSGWITKEQICIDLFGEYTDSKDRNLRDAIADLVTYLHRPYIGMSNNIGYKRAESEDEIDAGIADLEKRTRTTKLRILGLREAKGLMHDQVRGAKTYHLVQTSFLQGSLL